MYGSAKIGSRLSLPTKESFVMLIVQVYQLFVSNFSQLGKGTFLAQKRRCLQAPIPVQGHSSLQSPPALTYAMNATCGSSKTSGKRLWWNLVFCQPSTSVHKLIKNFDRCSSWLELLLLARTWGGKQALEDGSAISKSLMICTLAADFSVELFIVLVWAGSAACKGVAHAASMSYKNNRRIYSNRDFRHVYSQVMESNCCKVISNSEKSGSCHAG